MSNLTPKLRIDKWLWQARFFKSRALAAEAVASGVRIDGTRASKPARTVSPGNVLTFSQGRKVRIIRVVEIGTRRRPAPEAQALYEDLTPPEEPKNKPGYAMGKSPKFEGGGRPTKKDRRDMLKSSWPPLE